MDLSTNYIHMLITECGEAFSCESKIQEKCNWKQWSIAYLNRIHWFDVKYFFQLSFWTITLQVSHRYNSLVIVIVSIVQLMVYHWSLHLVNKTGSTYNVNIVVHLHSVCTSSSAQTVIPFHVKRAIQLWFNVTGNNKIYS